MKKTLFLVLVSLLLSFSLLASSYAKFEVKDSLGNKLTYESWNGKAVRVNQEMSIFHCRRVVSML